MYFTEINFVWVKNTVSGDPEPRVIRHDPDIGYDAQIEGIIRCQMMPLQLRDCCFLNPRLWRILNWE